MNRNLKSVRDLAAGGPFTEPQIRWLVFMEAQNGLAKSGAIVRVGRRVYIDVDKFEGWIDRQNQDRAAQPS